MDKSIFTNKTKPPSEKDLAAVLGKTLVLWNEITAFVRGGIRLLSTNGISRVKNMAGATG